MLLWWEHPATPSVLTAVGVVAHALLIISFLLLERRRPTATIAWLLALIFMPVVGIALYWLIGSTKLRRLSRRAQRLAPAMRSVLDELSVNDRIGESHTPSRQDERTAALMRLGSSLSSTPATAGNTAQLLVDGAATYRAIINAIEGATHHIHVQFYIIQPDSVGGAMRDRLAKRAAEGIRVRVLTDAVGSHSLPSRFWKPLTDAGGQAGSYRKVRFLNPFKRRDRIDFRNHRKNVIVDGRLGYTGGINVGREYLGLNPDLGHWRDTHVKLTGPSVLSLQQTFAEDWYTTTGELLGDPRYYPEPDTSGDCVVQVVDSGPDQKWTSIERFFVQAMMLATRRVWITSPYFIPDPVVEEALITTALRGVDVKLLLPKKSDQWFTSLASRSYYLELLEAGVQIFEYDRGFVHAKTIVVDDWVSTVGSANMDIRSFNLNFELNAFVFSAAFAKELAGQFLRDLEHASAVALERERSLAAPRRLIRATARLMSPLL